MDVRGCCLLCVIVVGRMLADDVFSTSSPNDVIASFVLIVICLPMVRFDSLFSFRDDCLFSINRLSIRFIYVCGISSDDVLERCCGE